MQYLKEFTKQNRALFLGTFVLIFVQSIGTLLIPFLVAAIIDAGILAGSQTAILHIGFQMLIVSVITVFASIAGSWLSAEIAAKLGHRLRKDFFAASQELSVQQLDSFGTASLLTRTTSDVTNIQQVMMMFLQMILPAPFLCVASILLTGMIHVQLMLIPLVSIGVFIIISSIVIWKARPEAVRTQKQLDYMTKVLREFYTGARVIRAFRKTDFEEQRTNQANERYAAIMIRVNRLFAVLNPAVCLVIGLSLVATLFFGGLLSVSGAIEVGNITAILEYTIISLGYITMASMVVVMIPRAFVSLGRINELLTMIPEVADQESAAPATAYGASDQPVISFQEVSFAYEEAEEPVLSAISFDVYAGQTTAIIGGTGSGKSTIAKALLRFKDISAGQILLNGQPITQLKQQQLRNAISYVPQKAFLFSGTIKDNLLFGNPNASAADLQHAAAVAQADVFIQQQPLAYDAPVAQKGTNFSGGQKQRLSIARALIKPAEVYFFDDSFSALDYQTDALLRKQLNEAYQENAKIIIAQRINTIIDADQIIVLHEGKIVGKGTHHSLMNDCQVYQDFARSQGIGGTPHEQATQFRSA